VITELVFSLDSNESSFNGFISNHYNHFKFLKITNKSDPNAFQMGKIVLAPKCPYFGLGKSWQP
jgi:hypothetical protein